MRLVKVIVPDDVDSARWALALNDRAGGIVSVMVPPFVPSLTALAREILVALGKSRTTNPHWRSEREALQLVGAWAHAYRIEGLVLVHGEWVRPSLVEDLGRVAADWGLDLWWLTTLPDQPVGLDRLIDEEIGWTGFVERITLDQPRRRERAGLAEHSLAGPVPPLVPALAARPLRPSPLPAGNRDALLAYADARAALEILGTTPSSGQIAAFVRRSVERTAADDLPDRLRGIAVALAERGWELRADPTGFGAAELPPASGPSWASLGWPEAPYQPAAGTLRLAGVSVDQMATIEIRDVAPSGAHVRVGGSAVVIPDGGRPYVRAQLHLRESETGASDAPYLAHHGRPLGRQRLVNSLAALFAAARLPSGRPVVLAQVSASERWLAGHGLALQQR